MAKFTKARRQAIINAFAAKHGNKFHPRLFLQEVQTAGAKHPAYEWFEWHNGKAADAYRLEQSRQFAQGIRIVIAVEEIVPGRSVKIIRSEAPAFISPLNTRANGGGYVVGDNEDDEYLEMLCKEAAQSFRQCTDRFAAALLHRGIDRRDLDIVILKLEGSMLSAGPTPKPTGKGKRTTT